MGFNLFVEFCFSLIKIVMILLLLLRLEVSNLLDLMINLLLRQSTCIRSLGHNLSTLIDANLLEGDFSHMLQRLPV
jgi:hypothetical protein